MAIRSPFGFVQATSTIRATVILENCAICITLGPPPLGAARTCCWSGDDLVYWTLDKSHTVCTSPLLLTVKRDIPVGEKERKLHPNGAANVATGWMEDEPPRVSISATETTPGSLVAGRLVVP